MEDRNPLDLFVETLCQYVDLNQQERADLRALPFTMKSVHRSERLIRKGPAPAVCPIVISGFAYREWLLADGKRQILSLHYPGDALDLQSLFLEVIEFNLVATTDTHLALVSRADLRRLATRHSNIANAIQADVAVEASILRAWLANVGQRDATRRVAHLLCEFDAQLDLRGLSHSPRFELPLVQEQIADALGLTPVHVNRTLRLLTERELIKRHGRLFEIPNFRELRSFADFDSYYLHLGLRSQAKCS